jgi:two-component system response regulator FixJ
MKRPGTGTVYVIDDDRAVRDSLLFLLDVEGLKARGFASVAAFLAAVPERATGCVVSDMRMPGLDGSDLLRMLPLHRAGLPVIVITGHGDVTAAVRAMEAGAFDFIEKPFQDSAILEAVRAALPGADNAARERRAKAICDRVAGLSEAEYRLLKHLLRGDSNGAVASALQVALADVDLMRARIMRRLGAQSLAELVRNVGPACRQPEASACSP